MKNDIGNEKKKKKTIEENIYIYFKLKFLEFSNYCGFKEF